MNLPIDFEQKAKLPPGIKGNSYPYQISARHLMENFRYSALQVDQTPVDGLQLLERKLPDGSRIVGLSGSIIGGGSDITHEWQVLPVEGDLYNVIGGTVWTQGGSVTVSDTPITLASGFIYLQIERDEITREIAAASVLSGASVPTSDQQYQYVPIAVIGGFPDPIIQLQFDELKIFEDLVISNGSFQLISINVATRNTYDPP